MQLHQETRHVDLSGVAGEQLQARRAIPGCSFATTLLSQQALCLSVVQAGCEVADEKSKVLSYSISVLARLHEANHHGVSVAA